MTDEMKLLMALCDAMGFDVKRTSDFKGCEISEEEGHSMIQSTIRGHARDYHLEVEGNGVGGAAYKRGENNSYFKRLKSPIVDYKLTRRSSIERIEGANKAITERMKGLGIT